MYSHRPTHQQGRGSQHPLEKRLAASIANTNSGVGETDLSPRPLAARDANRLSTGPMINDAQAKRRSGSGSLLSTKPSSTSSTAVASTKPPSPSIVETFTVMARVRPRLAREIEMDSVRVDPEDGCVTVTGDVATYATAARTTRHKFDRVFDRATNQAQVYGAVAPFIESAFNGFNTTIFA